MITLMERAEEVLIAQATTGDTAAFGELVDRYKSALVRHCYVIVRDPDVAQDVAQDSFIDAYQYLKSYRPDKAKFSTWLFKIATNNALREIKTGARTTQLDDTAAHQIRSEHIGPSETAEHAELHAAVMRLPDDYRAVVSMFYWEGMSYEEIAAVLGKPEGTIKGWLSRAKDQLRKEVI
jgi:RNA polymerase sigma-70 factor (ECF subfamily)